MGTGGEAFHTDTEQFAFNRVNQCSRAALHSGSRPVNSSAGGAVHRGRQGYPYFRQESIYCK
jgi:hypothetical protein